MLHTILIHAKIKNAKKHIFGNFYEILKLIKKEESERWNKVISKISLKNMKFIQISKTLKKNKEVYFLEIIFSIAAIVTIQ